MKSLENINKNERKSDDYSFSINLQSTIKKIYINLKYKLI